MMEEDDQQKPPVPSRATSELRELASSSSDGSPRTSSGVRIVPIPELVFSNAVPEDPYPSLGGKDRELDSPVAAAGGMDGVASDCSQSISTPSGNETASKSTQLLASSSPLSSSALDFELPDPISLSVVSNARNRDTQLASVDAVSTLELESSAGVTVLPSNFLHPRQLQPLHSFPSFEHLGYSIGIHDPPAASCASASILDISVEESFPNESPPTSTPAPNPIPRAFEQQFPPISREFRSSSLGSPRRPSAQPLMPYVPPELARLLESAIAGNTESLEDLKSVVIKERGDSRSVVDALLATMGGVDGFDESSTRNSGDPPSIMLNPHAAIVSAKLIPWLPSERDSKTSESPRSRMSRGLLAILNACTRNRTMCSSCGLLSALLESLERIVEFNSPSSGSASLCQCIQLIAGHSVTVVDLNQWLRLVKKTLNTEWAAPLMLTLEKAMLSEEMRGPSCSFEFDGESSGLLGPGESRWPFSNGFAFATWIYIESFADTLNTAAAAAAIAAAAAAKSGKSSAMSAAAAATALAGEGTTHMPRLFSFISSDNLGFEAYFHGQFLVVESGVGKGKKASLHFTHAFKPQCWYFVGLEHTNKHALMGKVENELRLYVDGRMYESRPFELPRISKALAFSCIGTNPPPTMAGLQQRRRQCPLFAEVGPIYIFKEPIGPEIMSGLASRGGDALPCFGNGLGSPWSGMNDSAKSLAEESLRLDIAMEGNLHLLYHPSLLSGRFCPDASPTGAAGVHRRPCEVLGQVHVTSRVRPSESMWALAHGGPMALLPLSISRVKVDSLEPILGDFSLCLGPVSIAASILRIITIAIQHPGNTEEINSSWAPEILLRILYHLLQSISFMELRKQNMLYDEELLAAVISLCQSDKNSHLLKVQLFSILLLDLKAWSLCKYSLQKKLLSLLADLVFSETSAMHDANALQLLLDGCRRCYWVIHEVDSFDSFPTHQETRSVGEINLLVDELMVVIELLIGAAHSSLAITYMRCLISFLIECPQPNQVARVLHLIYRLVVQPNSTKADVYAQSFISCGGIDTIIFLLQRETQIKDDDRLPAEHAFLVKTTYEKGGNEENLEEQGTDFERVESFKQNKTDSNEEHMECGSSKNGNDFEYFFEKNAKRASTVDSQLSNAIHSSNLSVNSGSIPIINLHSGNDDGITVGIIKLLGALAVASSSYLKVGHSSTLSSLPNKTPTGGLYSVVSGDKVALLLFAFQKALQAAPCRLMTTNTYMALLYAVINVPSSDVGIKLYDTAHRFEHVQLLLVLLRSLPYASRAFQVRALQDLLFLACSNPENRNCLTSMEEWPEWILEILISNYEAGSIKVSDDVCINEIEDLIYNFLIIMLEHSMRQKNGWMDVEAMLHCAEWLVMVGGSSTGDQRIRREESLPIFKRRLLGGLLDFAIRELQVQTQVIAAAAAGVAAEGLSPDKAKEEAEKVAHSSVALAENAIVILMIVEDHLRSQAQAFCSSMSVVSCSNSVGATSGASLGTLGSRMSLSHNSSAGVSLDVLASMADENGQISAAVMERLTAAAAAEPYDSVRGAFISYGSCSLDIAEGWKYRSRLWYGVGLPSNPATFGGGGSGWPSWKSSLEMDSNGKWVDLPLLQKAVAMLQALLQDESGLGGSLGIGGGLGTGMGGMAALYQLLNSDQPFLCMLRIVLASLREDDCGKDDIVVEDMVEVANSETHGTWKRKKNTYMSTRNPCAALLWSVLAPILNMPISESKRQRVLVASCILYSEVWHAVSKDRVILRKKYLEAIIPPYITILRRWRPLLAGIHEFTSPDGLNPLFVDDHALAVDTMPVEVTLYMVSPEWAAAFASPPAAMALAMVAAGVGGEATRPIKSSSLKHDPLFSERNPVSLNTFLGLPTPPDMPTNSLPAPKVTAATRAAAMAAARDRERLARIGSGKGFSAVAMATSTQRRNETDLERAKRWNITEAMGSAWKHCIQSVDMKPMLRKDFSTLQNKYSSILLESLSLVRNLQYMEISRRSQVHSLDQLHTYSGSRAWRKFIYSLIEMDRLFGPFGDSLSGQHVIWKLDFMEGFSRMRRFFKRDHHGSEHFGAAADYEDHVSPTKSDGTIACRKNSKETPFTADLPSKASILIPEAISVDDGNDGEVKIENDILDSMAENHLKMLKTTGNSSDESNAKVSTDSYDQVILPIPVMPSRHVQSDYDEKFIFELSSLMVRPLKVVKGTFQITTKRINFLVHNRCYGSSMDLVAPNNEKEKDRSWLISSLHQMYSRRYLLRRSALELFMVDRSNFFFDFGSIDARKDAYRAIVQAQPPHLNNIYLATQRPDQLFKRTQLMERWARWEISNFEYLMELNTMAGRGYNDITQYPVFPWILADYSSNILDLNNPSSYRDLSKPIGALNPERLEKYQERYSCFDDPAIPKFHYGSHYSTAGTVLYYLVRVEPFTTLSIQLQGGKFDHADRMFFDVGGTWNGVLDDMSDVKELVPELFYLPEIFTNENSFDFGATQLGEKMDSVKLPPWALNPVDFIHKHRMALESEYVSSHLHEWIDLIFGYKQRGKEAVQANNMFFYITYEGAVDIDKITDPVLQRATQDQIAYFGQTPSQLLTTPHLKRRPKKDALHLQTVFCNPNEVRPYVVHNPDRCNVPASSIHASQDSIIVVDLHAPVARVALHKWQPNTPDGQGTPFLFQHGKPAASSTGGSFMRMFRGPVGSASEEWQFPRALAFAASGIQNSAVVAITSDKEIITGGHADSSIKVISADAAKTIEIARGHCAPVTCLALSTDNNYLVSGSRDATVLLWKIHRAPPSPPRNSSASSIGPVKNPSNPLPSSGNPSDNSRMCRIEGPVHVLRGHLGEIISCSVSSELSIAASSSYTSCIILHSLRGRLIRKLPVEKADSVCLSSKGLILVWSKSDRMISTFTVNGIPVASTVISPFPFPGSISCITVSADGEYALIGTCSTSNEENYNKFSSFSIEKPKNRIPIRVPSICFLNLHTLEVFHTLKLAEGQDVTAISLNEDNTNLLVSTADKQLTVYTDPALSLKVVDQMLRLGWEGDGLAPLMK